MYFNRKVAAIIINKMITAIIIGMIITSTKKKEKRRLYILNNINHSRVGSNILVYLKYTFPKINSASELN